MEKVSKRLQENRLTPADTCAAIDVGGHAYIYSRLMFMKFHNLSN